jgi:hypothetical protein
MNGHWVDGVISEILYWFLQITPAFMLDAAWLWGVGVALLGAYLLSDAKGGVWWLGMVFVYLFSVNLFHNSPYFHSRPPSAWLVPLLIFIVGHNHERWTPRIKGMVPSGTSYVVVGLLTLVVLYYLLQPYTNPGGVNIPISTALFGHYNPYAHETDIGWIGLAIIALIFYLIYKRSRS